MDDTITTTGTTTTVGPLPPTTTSTTASPASGDSVAPVSGDARTSIAAQATAAANNRRRTPGSSSSTDNKTGGTGEARKTGTTDPAQSMSRMGTGARDTSDSKLIDDSTKLFPSSSGDMGGGGMGTMAGEGEGNVFRNERSASMSSSSSTGSDRLMGSASTVTEFPHHRRSSHALFEGLTAQKRRNDPASVARRKSLSEQRPPTGFIAKMWDNWVRGVPPDI
ncbi:hypothetical protein QBC45DRAFT_356631 [Copromyces sp. CBS 386.78]|nr:hypothetical protein QBC45DRAFT_356631 [Copromyces sp. CBS 386.78]